MGRSRYATSTTAVTPPGRPPTWELLTYRLMHFRIPACRLHSSSQPDYLRLLHEIRRHNDLYYGQANPAISDNEYDALFKSAEAIEADHPEWMPNDTPTRTVGEMPTTGSRQVRHSEPPMLSLRNTYSMGDVVEFLARCRALVQVCTRLTSGPGRTVSALARCRKTLGALDEEMWVSLEPKVPSPCTPSTLQGAHSQPRF